MKHHPRRPERMCTITALVFFAVTLTISLATAQDGSDSPPPVSLEDWKAHDGYSMTEEQRQAERDGEERTVTDHILTVPLDMEFVWIEALGIWVGRYEVTNAQYSMPMVAKKMTVLSGCLEGSKKWYARQDSNLRPAV